MDILLIEQLSTNFQFAYLLKYTRTSELRTPKLRAPLSTGQLPTSVFSAPAPFIVLHIFVKRSHFRHEDLSVAQQIMEHETR